MPSVFFALENTPSDFGEAASATVTARYRAIGDMTTPIELYARLYQSDETTPLSDEVLVVNATTPVTETDVGPVNFTGVVAADKATWDAALIRWRWG